MVLGITNSWRIRQDLTAESRGLRMFRTRYEKYGENRVGLQEPSYDTRVIDYDFCVLVKWY